MANEAQIAFFSYCREDSEFALKLAEDLKSAGAHVWIDQLDIEPGTPWDRAIEEALNNAPRMLVVLSPVSVNSDNVRDEVSFALSQRKRVIPVLYRDCDVPFRLARLQHIDFRPDYQRGLKILLRSLGVGEAAYADATHAEPAHVEGHFAKDETVAEAEEASANQQAHAEEAERERAAAAERARLDEERKAADEKDRMEEARKMAAEQVQQSQENRERSEADTRARQEQLRREQRAAEQARLEEEARQAAERVRLAQQQQARQAAEIRARQEQLRREQQESVERARFDAAALDQQQREATAKQGVGDNKTAAKSSRANAATQPPQLVRDAQASRGASGSAKYIGAAIVLLLLIGLTVFWFTQRSKTERLQESKAAGREAAQAVEAQRAEPGPAERNPGAAASPTTTVTSSPGESGGDHGASSATAGTEGPGQEGSKIPASSDKAAQTAAKSPANVSKIASEMPGIPNRVQLPADVSKDFLIQEVVPVYPQVAREARVHGIVKLHVLVDKGGAVQSIRAVSGHPLLIPAAIDAVKKWRYRPFVVDKKPVEVDTLVTVNFKLTN